MTKEEMKELQTKFLEALHENCGICQICGKKDCADKANNSTLPTKLDRTGVLNAMLRTFNPSKFK